MFIQFIELLDPSFLRNDQNRLVLTQNDPNNFGLCLIEQSMHKS